MTKLRKEIFEFGYVYNGRVVDRTSEKLDKLCDVADAIYGEDVVSQIVEAGSYASYMDSYLAE